jgi:probable HAF family extracellular repeat protein
MRSGLFAATTRGAAWLVGIGLVVSQAHADPITYNVTNLGGLNATGFDAAGDLVGMYTNPGPNANGSGFVYTTSGSNAGAVQVLPFSSMPPTWVGTNPSPPPGYQANQFGVVDGNAAGQAVGVLVPLSSGGAPGPALGWVYSGGQFTMLPGNPYDLQINASGQVIYNNNDMSGNSHAYLYTNGQSIDLGTLPNGTQAQAQGINNQGQIVGVSPVAETYGPPFATAFLYQNGQMYNLRSLVSSANAPEYLYGALAINNLGQILALGTGQAGPQEFLLTPSNLTAPPSPPSWAVSETPEPSVLAFFGLAMAAFGGREAMRRRTAAHRAGSSR